MSRGEPRRDFPALRSRGGQQAPAYLDSACMSLVPEATLDAMREYYTEYPGCAGRSLHRWAETVGRRLAASRERAAKFFGVADAAGVVFLRNATEAINLVGAGLPWKRGDRVLISDQEHNSNLVLWQRLVRERGIRIDLLRLSADGSFSSEALERAVARRPRLVSLFHTSNLDGRTLPLREIVERAHDRGALALFDGCQAAPHRAVDFERTGVDFYAVSAHKMLGPTGTGILLGRPECLSELRPLVVGGETVEWTTLTDHVLRPAPYRFEAGLQNYGGILGARAGFDYLSRVGLDRVEAIQRQRNTEVTRALEDEPRIHVLGPADPAERPSIFGCSIDGVDPHDAALFLDEGWDVLVRSGMHCVHSWYDARGLTGSLRASFYLYNDAHDARAFVRGIQELLRRLPAPSRAGRVRASSRRSARARR
ncbi:MAG: aminotransferase class V-fold PLP-dependent enzyme [Thermoplasmata archaeon]